MVFPFLRKEAKCFMYYVSMKIGDESRIIAMSNKEKYITKFVSFFFKGSHDYFISCVTDSQKDPDIYTIVKVSKSEGIYLPVWMLKYIQDEYDGMTKSLVKSLSCLHTIFKNNGDTIGMNQVDALVNHTFKSKDLQDPELKSKMLDDYISMHWICVVPFDARKMKTLSMIIDSIEYMTDTEMQYEWRIHQEYT